ncbi:hypothetical protein FJT64_015095 [Amphibalanus amphitrite]|uniref:Uncharacterized protein n=1 Tax=Amphibalanus amphitrite TaxID=1232801 RepID=A0A6A4XHD3_AMPAM|nr:translation initiation factor IF-2-like [Amphibalanus amphitrite]KAF0314441.1 hypothetical protein FJT64_015095 [Amphibalanus amphitrite]
MTESDSLPSANETRLEEVSSPSRPEEPSSSSDSIQQRTGTVTFRPDYTGVDYFSQAELFNQLTPAEAAELGITRPGRPLEEPQLVSGSAAGDPGTGNGLIAGGRPQEGAQTLPSGNIPGLSGVSSLDGGGGEHVSPELSPASTSPSSAIATPSPAIVDVMLVENSANRVTAVDLSRPAGAAPHNGLTASLAEADFGAHHPSVALGPVAVPADSDRGGGGGPGGDSAAVSGPLISGPGPLRPLMTHNRPTNTVQSSCSNAGGTCHATASVGGGGSSGESGSGGVGPVAPPRPARPQQMGAGIQVVPAATFSRPILQDQHMGNGNGRPTAAPTTSPTTTSRPSTRPSSRPSTRPSSRPQTDAERTNALAAAIRNPLMLAIGLVAVMSAAYLAIAMEENNSLQAFQAAQLQAQQDEFAASQAAAAAAGR